ncbi:Retrovirus-related Pol polyprotein from transposon 17.6 [Araneus ventricosus]|uniref:Retrovirus-related Pol polyprotein from transposon 17.6 n=1 Tax=Araneus ventricosus TaxID=182803 RepID=A0A4Y2TH34_ARAVE|nr:Retrovirus-related Pol polyprotein from transposon 17.6 [Araneus ventricosus]
MSKAFDTIKGKLVERPVLHAPDYSKQFIIQVDSSNTGTGVVLCQRDKKGEEHPILYLSRKFIKAELNYCTTEKECLGIIYAIKKLHHYLDGQPFKIETNHNPLVWLQSNVGNNQRLMRWSLALQPFNYTIIHRSGKSIKHVDALSRV